MKKLALMFVVTFGIAIVSISSMNVAQEIGTDPHGIIKVAQEIGTEPHSPMKLS